MTTYAKYADMYRQRLARSQDARVSQKHAVVAVTKNLFLMTLKFSSSFQMLQHVMFHQLGVIPQSTTGRVRQISR